MLTALTVLLMLTGLAGQQRNSQEIVELGQPTRFELSAEKTTCSVAEAVGLTVTLHNDQNFPIKGYFYLTLDRGLWIYYRKVGGEFDRYFPRWLQLLSMGDLLILPIQIPANGKEETTVRLLYDTSDKRFVLDAPGEYEFKATFNLGNNRIIESNVVQVTVAQPSEEERAVLAALSDPVLASFIEGDLRITLVEDAEVEAGAEKAVAFLEKYSQSIHATLVETQLKEVLTEAAQKSKLTKKLQAIRERLPNK